MVPESSTTSRCPCLVLWEQNFFHWLFYPTLGSTPLSPSPDYGSIPFLYSLENVVYTPFLKLHPWDFILISKAPQTEDVSHFPGTPPNWEDTSFSKLPSEHTPFQIWRFASLLSPKSGPVTKVLGILLFPQIQERIPFFRPQILQNAFQNFLNIGATFFPQPLKSEAVPHFQSLLKIPSKSWTLKEFTANNNNNKSHNPGHPNLFVQWLSKFSVYQNHLEH